MIRFFAHEEDDLLAFLDTMINVAFGFIGMFVLSMLLPHLKAEAENKVAGIAPGRMCATLTWPGTNTGDVDLWGRAPDGTIVGYSARASNVMDLLRDDLGHDAEKTGGNNFEMMCSKVLQKGAWTFNAHFFGTHKDGDREAPLTLTISFPIGSNDVRKQDDIVVQGTLHDVGDEITMLDFELDSDGIVVPGSQNNVFQPIRTQK